MSANQVEFWDAEGTKLKDELEAKSHEAEERDAELRQLRAASAEAGQARRAQPTFCAPTFHAPRRPLPPPLPSLPPHLPLGAQPDGAHAAARTPPPPPLVLIGHAASLTPY